MGTEEKTMGAFFGPLLKLE